MAGEEEDMLLQRDGLTNNGVVGDQSSVHLIIGDTDYGNVSAQVTYSFNFGNIGKKFAEAVDEIASFQPQQFIFDSLNKFKSWSDEQDNKNAQDWAKRMLEFQGIKPDDPEYAAKLQAEIEIQKQIPSIEPSGGVKVVRGLPGAIKLLSKAPGPKLILEEAQFGQKIGKHAQDFGLNPGSPQNRQWLKDLITDIHTNPNEIRKGPWRGIGEVMENGNRTEGTALFYRKGADVVVTDLEGNFVTILKDGATQNLRFKNAQNIFGTPIE